jgi:hypothetical protein
VSGVNIQMRILKQGMMNQAEEVTSRIPPDNSSAATFASAQLHSNICQYPNDFFSRVQHVLMQKLRWVLQLDLLMCFCSLLFAAYACAAA